ncbi:MAG TPA: type II toxin-antitoxin system RelE/ParE family toxin [Asticcacaulis sp.]|nr:type II toxin-antitoxin system RelE/ParE family toxin [Asticcacaulis sp.]
MPRVVLTANAAQGLRRCQAFLYRNSPSASQRAAAAIFKHLKLLETVPEAGRPGDDGLRELVIPFGDAGYVALYAYEPDLDIVSVLALRHQREDDY